MHWAYCPSPRMLGIHLSTLVGSGYHLWTQYVWVQATHLEPLSLFGHLARAQHSSENFSGTPHRSLSVFHWSYIYYLSIIQFKISHEWNYNSAPLLYKMTKLIGYKYTMNSSSQRFTVSSYLTFLTFIFSESL
jgi:hypothetical protein